MSGLVHGGGRVQIFVESDAFIVRVRTGEDPAGRLEGLILAALGTGLRTGAQLCEAVQSVMRGCDVECEPGRPLDERRALVRFDYLPAEPWRVAGRTSEGRHFVRSSAAAAFAKEESLHTAEDFALKWDGWPIPPTIASFPTNKAERWFWRQGILYLQNGEPASPGALARIESEMNRERY